MSIVIDVDAHFEPGEDWMAKRPDLAKRLPRLDGGELAIKTICGDLIASMPAHLRPTKEELTPPGLLTLFAKEKSDEKEVEMMKKELQYLRQRVLVLMEEKGYARSEI